MILCVARPAEWSRNFSILHSQGAKPLSSRVFAIFREGYGVRRIQEKEAAGECLRSQTAPQEPDLLAAHVPKICAWKNSSIMLYGPLPTFLISFDGTRLKIGKSAHSIGLYPILIFQQAQTADFQAHFISHHLRCQTDWHFFTRFILAARQYRA